MSVRGGRAGVPAATSPLVKCFRDARWGIAGGHCEVGHRGWSPLVVTAGGHRWWSPQESPRPPRRLSIAFVMPTAPPLPLFPPLLPLPASPRPRTKCRVDDRISRFPRVSALPGTSEYGLLSMSARRDRRSGSCPRVLQTSSKRIYEWAPATDLIHARAAYLRVLLPSVLQLAESRFASSLIQQVAKTMHRGA